MIHPDHAGANLLSQAATREVLFKGLLENGGGGGGEAAVLLLLQELVANPDPEHGRSWLQQFVLRRLEDEDEDAAAATAAAAAPLAAGLRSCRLWQLCAVVRPVVVWAPDAGDFQPKPNPVAPLRPWAVVGVISV